MRNANLYCLSPPGFLTVLFIVFVGAVQVLRQVNEIDFKLLYTGRVSLDELQRIKRLARLDCLKLPHFLKDISTYKRTLNEIALLNGLITQIKRPLSSKTRNKKKSATSITRNRGSVTSSRVLSSPARSRTQVFTPRPPLLSTRSRRNCWRNLDEISSPTTPPMGR